MSKKLTQSTGLQSKKEWYEYCKSRRKPKNIPYHPNINYENYWTGWSIWLDNGRTRNWRNFNAALKFVHSLKLKSEMEWRSYCKSGEKPNDIPSAPRGVYPEWQGFGHWLKNGRTRSWRNFNEATKFVHSLKLKSQPEWNAYCQSGKKPMDIPAHPVSVYTEQWINWGDWLGTGNVATFNRNWRNFNEAVKFVHSLKLKSVSEWKQYSNSGKKPNNIPVDPYQTYKKHWKNWKHWLGTDNA